MTHFASTTGETVLQLSSIGPWQVIYVADDPRTKQRERSLGSGPDVDCERGDVQRGRRSEVVDRSTSATHLHAGIFQPRHDGDILRSPDCHGPGGDDRRPIDSWEDGGDAHTSATLAVECVGLPRRSWLRHAV